MAFEIVAHKSGLVGHGDGVVMYGSYVTERVHGVVSQIIEDCWTNSEYYQARQKCGAFFQGGSHDPKGKYIFIEFLGNSDSESVKDFLRLLNNSLSPVIGSALTAIEIWPNTEGAYYFITEIAKETGCSYDSGSSVQPVTFNPENNDMHNKVMTLCRQMELTIVNKPH